MTESIKYYGKSDTHTANVMSDLRREMSLKIEHLRVEQERLMEVIAKGFDYDEYRKLNVINHRIEVAESRHNGEWLHGNFPQIASTK